MLVKSPAPIKRKRSTSTDFTQGTFAKKKGGGVLKKACIPKEKGLPVLTLHTAQKLELLGTCICIT